jgi:hypothetical protein
MVKMEEYLVSEQARQDVRALLAALDSDPARIERDGMLLEAASCGKWTEVAPLLGSSVHAYFIRQGVVDVLAAFDLDWTDQGIRGAYFEGDGYRVVCNEALISGAHMKSSWVADLPDAICRVLLASWRIANLETK